MRLAPRRGLDRKFLKFIMATTSLQEGAQKHLYEYGPVCRIRRENGQRIPEHFRVHTNNGKSGWFRGHGQIGWPSYRLEECVHHLRAFHHSMDSVELWEFCTEEAVEMAVAGGLQQSFCMPTHGRSHEERLERYRYLRKEGCWVIYYIWDNDDDGQSRAFAANRAAKEAGIVLQMIPTLKAWPECPAGGSIANHWGAESVIDALLKHCEFDLDSCASEFIEEDKNCKLPEGSPCPKPTGEIWAEDPPIEPEKKKNDAFTYERVSLLSCALSGELRADHEQPSSWFHFDGTKWKLAHSNDKVDQLLENLYDRWEWKIRDVSTVNSDRAGLRRAVGSDLPPSNGRLLPFTNGCLDLDSKVLINHAPGNGNRYCLPFAYAAGNPKPQEILKFLQGRLGSEEVVQLYRSFIWHILTNTSMKAFLEVTGPGNTGKTVLTNLVIALIGADNTTSCSLKRLEDAGNKFETNRIRNKRLAVFSESQEYSGSLEMLKALTGQDRIPAERKFSSAILDFVFSGGVILTGNSPVRSSDTTGAVINRRRSILVDKVVAASEEKVLIEFDGFGGLRGELVEELPAFVDWVLEMDPAEARRAIARDVASSARADAEKQVLLKTDHLAAWANERLIFDDILNQEKNPIFYCQVGNLDSDPFMCLLPNYRKWLEEREPVRAYGQRNFKHKLVDLLRDTISLPLPPGDHSKGFYRIDGTGSVVPFVRLRRSTDKDEVPGVIDAAFAKRIAPIDQRVANGETLVGNGTNESNDKSEVGLPYESERGQGLDAQLGKSSRGGDATAIHSNRLFHWAEGSQPSQSVGDSLGSSWDTDADGEDPAWGARPEVK